MGTLVGRHYRTTMMLKLADHTYVECGTGGKAWGCWGGKPGGAVLRSGAGSTRRADAIAGADERAGITCYLINGVCHQAANRILFPAGITVRGARGYWVSTSLFGVYGRASALFGLCKAPFNQQPGVTGDLPQCMEGTSTPPEHAGADPGEQTFLKEVLELSERQDAAVQAERAEEHLVAIQVEMFGALVRYRLGPRLEESMYGALLQLRQDIERRQLEVDRAWADGALTPDELTGRKTDIAAKFQKAVGGVLDDSEYEQLLELPKRDILEVGDPEIARAAYARPPRRPGPGR